MRIGSSCDLEVILFVFAEALSRRVAPGNKVSPDDVFAAIEAVYAKVKGAY